MMARMSKFAVIGSNSFSGSDFVDLLLQEPELEVIGISRSPEKSPLYLPYKRRGRGRFRFAQFDLVADLEPLLEFLDRERPSHIINFAALLEPAESWNRPEQWFYTNTLAAVRLADHLKDQGYLKHYVQISTPEIYGSCARPAGENSRPNPSTPYAASKAGADLFLEALAKHHGFPVSFVRSTNVFGPHQQLYRIIPRAIIHLKLGKPIELHGGGRAVRSFIHIRDVSRGEREVLRKGLPGAVYHFNSDEPMTVREVVRLVCRIMGADFDAAVADIGDRRGQDAAYLIDSTWTRGELGWAPQVTLEAGIREVLAWIEAHWDAIQREPMVYEHKFLPGASRLPLGA